MFIHIERYLNKLPQEIRDLISRAGTLASSGNMPVYLVGGFVRDLILDVRNLDLDIVVEADGIKFAEMLTRKLKARLIRHRRFGTATIVLKNHLKVDIATARKERYPQPAELPDVTSGELRDDLARRDFTINAMAISINRADFGRFIDFFAGREDLQAKKIRVLHDLSFIDDPTRILRAVRFEQRYNFKIEPKTFKFLKEAVSLRMLEKVQPQRLRDELILMLKEKDPSRQLRRLKELSGLKFISPGLSLKKNTALFLKAIAREISWFKQNYPRRRQLDSWLIYFIGLIDSLAMDKIKSVCRRFVFRRGEEKRILDYKKIKPGFIAELSRDKLKASRVFNLLEPLSYEIIICIRAKYSRQSGIPQNAGKNKNIRKHIADFFTTYNGTRLYICGEDLRRLGLMPGPQYQKIFHRVLNARLDNIVKTKKEELELIRKISKDA